ncbi:MAG: hypothetical protein ACOC95_09590 [Planctomycetota bacterium]
MRQLTAIGAAALAAVLVVLAGAGPVHAQPRVQPYVVLDVTPESLDLGDVAQPGLYQSQAELNIRVAANVAHGGLTASMTPLEREGGAGTIGPDRILVKRPGEGNYVPMTDPVILTGPMRPGVVDIPLTFRVQTTWVDRPGEYRGTLTITCVVAP